MSLAMILLEIEGLPVPWTPSRITRTRHAFNPKYKEKQYAQWQIKSQYNQEKPISGPVSLDLSFHMPIPAGTSKVKRLQMLNGKIFHIKRPDTSNLTKFLEDCLKGIVIEDDSQTVEIIARKLYAEKPKSVVKVTSLL